MEKNIVVLVTSVAHIEIHRVGNIIGDNNSQTISRAKLTKTIV